MDNLTQAEIDRLIEVLKLCFENNMVRHSNIEWDKVLKKISSRPDIIWSLNEMEKNWWRTRCNRL